MYKYYTVVQDRPWSYIYSYMCISRTAITCQILYLSANQIASSKGMQNSKKCFFVIISTDKSSSSYLRSESNASHGVRQVWHEKSSRTAPTTIVVTLSVDVSSVDRPNKYEHRASAYGMTKSDKMRKTLRMKMKGRRRPYLLRHLSLARPITGTKKNPSAGPIPSIILIFCSLSQPKITH